MKKGKNKNLRNSQGISTKEYLLTGQAGFKQDQHLFDADYLHKLSPEELAWYAEFSANYVSGVEVDKEIVGEETAELLNDKQNRRAAYSRKNARGRDHYNQRSQESLTNSFDKEKLLSVDSYLSMENEVEDAVDDYWKRK